MSKYCTMTGSWGRVMSTSHWSSYQWHFSLTSKLDHIIRSVCALIELCRAVSYPLGNDTRFACHVCSNL